MKRIPSAFVILLAAACDPLPECTADNRVVVGGETSGINGPVTVVADESEGRVSLSISTQTDDLHSASFELAGSALDELSGQVTADVGVVFAGEGSEYGYMRLIDERGVWFEGGRSGSIDGIAQGGATIDAPFVIGDETDEGCRVGGSSYDLAIFDLRATIGANSEAVLVGSEGTNGVWNGVAVRAVGVRADRAHYSEPPDTSDGLGPGTHDLFNLVGYLYRTPS